MSQFITSADTNHDTDERSQGVEGRNQRVIDLLNSWDQEDAEDQRETLTFLMRALDEDRSSTRKLFQ